MLRLRDLVLLNVSSIVALSSIAQVAQFGYASLSLFVIAILTFLIPGGLMVAELNARMPGEGGFYLWTRRAFGDLHGFVAAWSYWVSTIVWIPTVMLLVSVSCLYVFGDTFLDLANDPIYNSVVCLGVLWGITLLNIFGLERARWVQNVAGVATWLLVALLLIVGVLFVIDNGSSHPFSAGKLLPDLTDMSLLPYFAVVAFCFGGLELSPILAGEIHRPERTIPRALWLSSIAVGLIYMGGTLMLILIVPEGDVGIIEGVAQAFHVAGAASGVPWGAIGSLLVLMSTLGLLGSWLMGNARLPFVMGLDRYLPATLAWVHPRWKSPVHSLLMQAVLITVLFVSSISGSTIEEAFLILLDMSIILYFLPFLYMFAAFAWHMRHRTGGEGIVPTLQRSTLAVWTVAILGFGTTLLSTIVSAFPTAGIENKPLFVAKVVGGAVVLIGAGLAIYFSSARVHARAEQAEASYRRE